MSDSLTLDVGQFEALRAFLSDGPPHDMLPEMIRLFEEGVREWLVEAVSAIDREDTAVFGRVAHSLKGVCGTVGATRMRALAIDMEDAVTAGHVSQVGGLVRALALEFERVMALLAPYVHDRSDHTSALASCE